MIVVQRLRFLSVIGFSALEDRELFNTIIELRLRVHPSQIEI